MLDAALFLAIVRKQIIFEHSGCKKIVFMATNHQLMISGLTIVAQKALGQFQIALRSNEAANDKVANGHQQDDEQSDLRLVSGSETR